MLPLLCVAALHDAVREGFPKVAALIFSQGGELHMGKIELAVQLNTLAREGKPEKLQQYIAVGADVNSVDYDGRTPLHIGASEGHKAVVHVLLESGARIDAKDRWGHTAQVAAEHAKQHSGASSCELLATTRLADPPTAFERLLHLSPR